jgi:hypothetical protein
MTAIAELARLLARGDLELPTLSDDEVAALSPLVRPEARLVPLVTHAGLDDDARRERILAGEQSLIDRGLLMPTEDDRMTPSPELESILVVRDSPLSITIVDLVRNGEVASCYAYGLGDPTYVLTETVEAGQHDFAIRTPASTADALAAEIDAGAFAAGDGPELVQTTASTPPEWIELQHAFEAATGTIRLYSVHREPDDKLFELHSSAVMAPDAFWLVAGTLDRASGNGSVSARTLSRAGLAGVIRSFLTLEHVSQ